MSKTASLKQKYKNAHNVQTLDQVYHLLDWNFYNFSRSSIGWQQVHRICVTYKSQIDKTMKLQNLVTTSYFKHKIQIQISWLFGIQYLITQTHYLHSKEGWYIQLSKLLKFTLYIHKWPPEHTKKYVNDKVLRKWINTSLSKLIMRLW